MLGFANPVTLYAKIESLKHRLIRLHKVMSNQFPGNPHSILLPEQIDMQKLQHQGVIITDTCNQAQKIQRILCAMVNGALDYNCMIHLQNVWFGSMENNLTNDLNLHLCASLDEIDPKLRVTASMSALIHAVDKEFSLSANYPKGHGKLFLEWLREYYPGVLLLHVECATGSRSMHKRIHGYLHELRILC